MPLSPISDVFGQSLRAREAEWEFAQELLYDSLEQEMASLQDRSGNKN